MPLFRDFITATDGMFVPRAGNAKEKDDFIKQMGKRQRDIEEGRSSLTPLLVFPEGTTSNGTNILRFRRGAFESECTVRPMTIDYGRPVVHPANDCINQEIVTILSLC